MDHLNNIYFLAATGYNCDAYGSNAYGECSTTTSTSSGSSGGFLADTGYNVLLPLALGLALVIASVILLIKTLRRRTKSESHTS